MGCVPANIFLKYDKADISWPIYATLKRDKVRILNEGPLDCRLCLICNPPHPKMCFIGQGFPQKLI